jgi:ribosomal protein L29
MSFSAVPQYWMNAAVVFVQQRLVSQYAEQSGQNREAIYRDAHRLKEELEVAESTRNEQQQQIEALRAELTELRRQAAYNPATDPDKVAKYASQAQAEGVSLPVAQRLLKTLQPIKLRRSVRSAG